MNAAAGWALAAAVLMHVSWNLAARRADPRSHFLWWGLLAWLLAFGPWSIAHLIAAAKWTVTLAGLLLVTCAANTLYFVALGTAYRHGPVPLVYPIARSSPLWIAAWMALFFGERLPVVGWGGIALSVAGVLALALTARGGARARAVPWAVAAALGTSAYSIANKFAVSALPDYVALLGWISAAFAASWVGLTLQHWRQTGRAKPAVRPPLLLVATAGAFVGNAYALVIHAMRYIPAAYAVAFTNAGIVIAGLIAMIWFREREHWGRRLAAMLAICTGLSLLALR